VNLRDLLDRSAKLTAEMRSILSAPADGDDLSADQAQAFDNLKGQVEAVEGAITRARTVEDLERRAAGQLVGGGDVQLDRELRSFSLVPAIAGAADLQGIDDGREREISSELRRRTGSTADGIFCPMQVFERRAQTAGSGTAGGFLVGTDHRDDLFIDSLRSALVTTRLGATVISGLTGPVAIPRRDGSVTAEWIGENEDLTGSDQAFGQVSMTPRLVGALTELSRQLLLQTSNQIEALTRQDMAEVLARAVDISALNGNGVGKPLGLLNTDGIGTMDMSTITWSDIVEFSSDLENANSADTAFLTRPSVVGTLRATPKAKDGSSNALDSAMRHGLPVTAASCDRSSWSR